eukprot:6829900-Pyramimonas_sp.AAC.1
MRLGEFTSASARFTSDSAEVAIAPSFCAQAQRPYITFLECADSHKLNAQMGWKVADRLRAMGAEGGAPPPSGT